MKYNVCVVTGSRAEYGILRPLLWKIMSRAELELVLVVTGSHLSDAYGNTQTEIVKDGFAIAARIPLALTPNGGKLGMVNVTGEAIQQFGAYFTQHRPDIVVLLGDRFEIFGVATAAAMLNIPISHLHGGETTEGAVDEFLRHSITKMSTLHFTACEDYRRRVIQLGEDPARVFNVGALSIENMLTAPLMTLGELSESLQVTPLQDDRYCVVTYHPVTLETDTVQQQMAALIAALDRFEQYRYLITKSNADADGATINQIWDEAAKTHPNWIVLTSMGITRYLSALKHAAAMIGNSSSGILEGPAMKVPTVNIGDRQKGRMMAKSIINCAPTTDAICEAMTQALTDDFREKARHVINPFGGSDIAQTITDHLVAFLQQGSFDGKKTFCDWR